MSLMAGDRLGQKLWLPLLTRKGCKGLAVLLVAWDMANPPVGFNVGLGGDCSIHGGSFSEFSSIYAERGADGGMKGMHASSSTM